MHDHPAIALASDLIACPSVTPHNAGALEVLEGFLRPVGFDCLRFPFGEDEARVDNLVAIYGDAGAMLAFAGHVDVVPAGDDAAWTYPPFSPTIKNGYLYGRGAEDMKAAIAAFAVAAKEAIDAGEISGRLMLIITCDEEGDGIHGTAKVMEALKRRNFIPHACIVGEPTNPDALAQMAKIGRRGSFSASLTVKGKQGHVAYPHLAHNPVPEMIAILHALKTHVLDGGDAFFPPSNLEITSVDVGNGVGNVIPASIRAQFNVRFNTNHTGETLEAWVRDICLQHAKDWDLQCRTSAQAFLSQPAKLAEIICDAAMAVSGQRPVLTTTGGTSDARFIQAYCEVVEYGTTGIRAHMVDERIKIADIVALSQTYQHVIRAWFKEAK